MVLFLKVGIVNMIVIIITLIGIVITAFIFLLSNYFKEEIWYEIYKRLDLYG